MKTLLLPFTLTVLLTSLELHAQDPSRFELKIIKCANYPRYKAEINKILSEEDDIISVYNKIKVYFNPNPASGDAFTLTCKHCDIGFKFLKFPARLMLAKNQQPFASKGDHFNLFSDLQQLLSDSIAIIDSLKLSLAHMVDKNRLEPFDIRVEYYYKSRLIRRSISYNSQNEEMTISKEALFGQLPQSTIDTLAVSAYFYDVNAVKHRLNYSDFKPHFLTAEELDDIRETIRLYKQEFPQATTSELIDHVTWLLQLDYKHAYRENIEECLILKHL